MATWQQRTMIDGGPPTVPGPVSPDQQDAWYAEDVRSQYAIDAGIVATVTETETGYQYRTREPPLSERERAILNRASERFDGSLSRPRTRAGAVERVREGLPTRLRDRLPALGDRSPRSQRRLSYHLTASLRGLEELTPLALDDRIRIADSSGAHLTVHTRDFAPAETTVPADTPYLEQVLGERVRRETVPFAGFDVPVTIVRDHLLGADTFEVSYLIEEPERYPGDDAIIEAVIDRLLESPPPGLLDDQRETFLESARALVKRRVGGPIGGVEALSRTVHRWIPSPVTGLLAHFSEIRRPVAEPSRTERVEALTYYVARELLGEGILTIPLRDPAIAAIEANDVGDRVTVLTTPDGPVEGMRMPTSLTISEDGQLRSIARTLAAEGGIELSAHRPSATVSLSRPTATGSRRLHCSVALPDGPNGGHVSIAAGQESPPTPIALIERGRIEPALVAAIWTTIATGGSVLFFGPVGTAPSVVLGAHSPFIPSEDRPVEISAEGTGLDLPHETAVAVPFEPSRSRERWAQRAEREALHPDVAVLADLDSPTLFEQLGQLLLEGRQVVGAAHMASRTLLERSLRTAGVAEVAAEEIDLFVELCSAGSDNRATGWTLRPTEKSGDLTDNAWTQILDTSGKNPTLTEVFQKRLERKFSTGSLPTNFERRRRYIEYLTTQGATDREALVGFLSDLRTDEAATIERIRNREGQ